jgi:hypothetical protein
METIRFRSRIDAWLGVLVFGPFVVGFWFTVRDYLSAPHWAFLLGAGMCVLALVVCGWLFLGTSYTVTAADVIIRCGPMHITIPLASIRVVARSSSLISAPALSLRRLELKYGKYDTLLVSPLDQTGFIAALLARNPAIEVKGMASTVAPTAG